MKPLEPDTDRGSVMIFVIWGIVLLSLFVVSINSRAQASLGLTERLNERHQVINAARSAPLFAAILVEQDETPSIDGSSEMWSSAGDFFQERHLGSGTFSIQVFDPRTQTHRFGLLDEAQRISLNTASAEWLQRLFVQSGARPDEASDLAAAVEDWRDEDSRARQGGAERDYYKSLSNSYDCKDGPFENGEELLLVRGMTPELYHQVEPYVTVYAQSGVNLNTASRRVLHALGLSEEGVERLVYFRSGEDSQEGTADDRLLTSVNSIVGDLEQYLPIDDLQTLASLIEDEMVSVGTDTFRMEIEAWASDRNDRLRVTSVIDREGNVLLWQEH